MAVDGVNFGGSGTSLSELFQTSRRLLLKTRDGLERLERLEYPSSGLMNPASASASSSSSFSLEDSVKHDISQILSLCADMERLWRTISAKSPRDLWKRKVEQIAEEAYSLKDSLDKYSLRNQKRLQETKDRADLLGQTSRDSSHILQIFDAEAEAMRSVKSSSKMLDEAYATGIAVLSKYSEQRDHLKNAQRKALDVMNTLGLSNSVLKLIERRNRSDRWIKYTGMVITIVIVILVWRWTR